MMKGVDRIGIRQEGEMEMQKGWMLQSCQECRNQTIDNLDYEVVIQEIKNAAALGPRVQQHEESVQKKAWMIIVIRDTQAAYSLLSR